MMRSYLTTLLAICSLSAILAKRLDDFSFAGPFETVDRNGDRLINQSTWYHGGSTKVLKNFIRLTPDRQSKRGHIWAKAAMNRDTFSAIFQFRISGQAQRWFGDGIGLWLTEHANFINGHNHGFTSNYKGVGIVLDTFVNPEHGGGHKDVTVQINDGTKSLDTLNEEKKIGCMSNFRYHEASGSFNAAHSQSRLKLTVERNVLRIEIDERANGQYKPCYEGTLPFAQDWARDVTIGMTAATGSLADNHDIIGFSAFEEVDDFDLRLLDTQQSFGEYTKNYRTILEEENCGQSCKIMLLERQMQDLHVELEHQMHDLKEKTMNNLKELRKRESKAHDQIMEMEAEIADYVHTNVDDSILQVKEKLDRTVDAKVSRNLQDSGSWKTPFFLLIFGLCGSAYFVYQKYQQLRKSHFL